VEETPLEQIKAEATTQSKYLPEQFGDVAADDCTITINAARIRTQRTK
jgi:hypothetical protein